MNRMRFALVSVLILIVTLLVPAPADAAKTYTLTVTNKTCSPIAISVDGNFKQAIPAGTFWTVEKLKVGAHVLNVKGCSGSVDREIRVDPVVGNAYEEYTCLHRSGNVDPYKQVSGSTNVPPAPTVVPYQPPTTIIQVREERPLIEFHSTWGHRYPDYRYDSHRRH